MYVSLVSILVLSHSFVHSPHVSCGLDDTCFCLTPCLSYKINVSPTSNYLVQIRVSSFPSLSFICSPEIWGHKSHVPFSIQCRQKDGIYHHQYTFKFSLTACHYAFLRRRFYSVNLSCIIRTSSTRPPFTYCCYLQRHIAWCCDCEWWSYHLLQFLLCEENRSRARQHWNLWHHRHSKWLLLLPFIFVTTHLFKVARFQPWTHEPSPTCAARDFSLMGDIMTVQCCPLCYSLLLTLCISCTTYQFPSPKHYKPQRCLFRCLEQAGSMPSRRTCTPSLCWSCNLSMVQWKLISQFEES